MKLLIIHGAEATGKFTVGKEVARLTGYRLAHNHLSADLAGSLFAYGTPEHAELVWSARLMLFESAAKHALDGLIFTWAFSYPDFIPYLDLIKHTMRPYDTELLYVYLTCREDARRSRVTATSRKAHGKLTTVEGLEANAKRKHYAPIPGDATLSIDNTALPPYEAAEQIVEHFGLPLIRE
jgi:hypothetical protein